MSVASSDNYRPFAGSVHVGRLAADGSRLDIPFAPLALPAASYSPPPEVSLDPAGRILSSVVDPAVGADSPVRIARFLPPAPGRFATDAPAAGAVVTLAGPGGTRLRATGSGPGEPGLVTYAFAGDDPAIARVFTFAPFEDAFTGGVFVDGADF